VKPSAFTYERPESLAAAAELLVNAAGHGKILAGGQSLIPLLAFRLVRPSMLVDIGRIPGLDGVDGDAGVVRIGAMCTHREVEEHQGIKASIPLLAEGLRSLGHVAIRNVGTVGGSIAHADPAAEWPALGLALDAKVHVFGPSGTRVAPMDGFFRDWLQPDLAIGEIVTAIELPIPPPGYGWGFREAARRHGDFALAGAAVVAASQRGMITYVRIGLLGGGLTPCRARRLEAALLGRPVHADHLETVTAAVGSDISPLDDQHASADDRRHLATILTHRALLDAVTRAEVPT
jgi:carbon-monoxide dehydrogenase medium subunit